MHEGVPEIKETCSHEQYSTKATERALFYFLYLQGRLVVRVSHNEAETNKGIITCIILCFWILTDRSDSGTGDLGSLAGNHPCLVSKASNIQKTNIHLRILLVIAPRAWDTIWEDGQHILVEIIHIANLCSKKCCPNIIEGFDNLNTRHGQRSFIGLCFQVFHLRASILMEKRIAKLLGS